MTETVDRFTPRPRAARASDALAIQDGACNPAGIVRALRAACLDCLHEGVSQREDAAVRLMTHQLAWIALGTDCIDHELWVALMQICRADAAAAAAVVRG